MSYLGPGNLIFNLFTNSAINISTFNLVGSLRQILHKLLQNLRLAYFSDNLIANIIIQKYINTLKSYINVVYFNCM